MGSLHTEPCIPIHRVSVQTLKEKKSPSWYSQKLYQDSLFVDADPALRNGVLGKCFLQYHVTTIFFVFNDSSDGGRGPWLNTKIKDEKGQALIDQAVDIVLNAVSLVFQTYVESLKNSGNFNAEAQKIASNLAKSLVRRQLSEDAKSYISKNYGDLEEWIRNQIEASIYKLKN